MAAHTHQIPRRPPPRPKQQPLPRWVIWPVAGLLAILVYGLVTPKTQSAFDRPEAQVNMPGSPWNSPQF
jgi:hypothetical protein